MQSQGCLFGKLKKSGIAFEQLHVDISYPSNGCTTAKFAEDGLSVDEIFAMLHEVCVAVYFQQNDQGPIRRQVRGFPWEVSVRMNWLTFIVMPLKQNTSIN